MKKFIVKLVVGVFAMAFLSLSTLAEDSVLKAGHPDDYTVKKGDTLWDISSTFLNSPWKWPEIWQANPQIEDPHLIFPGDLIKLIYMDGQPRITSERTLKLVPGETGGRIDADGKLVPKVRVQQISDAITTIPLDRINSFLSHSKIVEPAELKNAPYLLAGPQKRIVVGAGDTAYARGNFSETLTNYGVYREGEVFRDPKTKEVLGIHALGVGSVNVQSIKDSVATVGVLRASEEIRIGDRLLLSEDRPMTSTFYPSSPEGDIQGVIIAVEGGVTQVGKYNVVMVNRGEREGIKVGNVLAIYKKGEIVKDRISGGKVALPDERAGLLMVFRTFNKMSFGLVLEADRQLSVGDLAVTP